MEPGSRVVAISHNDKNGTVYIFGYGVYEGQFPRPGTDIEKEIVEVRRMCQEEVADPDSILHKIEQKMAGKVKYEMPSEEELRKIAMRMVANPRIKLDSGQTVWGCECWWGPEDEFKTQYANKKIAYVDIDTQRAHYNKQEGQGCIG